MTQYRIVFMGSPVFSIPVLEALVGQYPVIGVITQPDRPAGRGRNPIPPPVKEAAVQLGVPVIQPERLQQPEAMEQLHSWQPDVIVVAAFGQILKSAVLDLPAHGCLNVHASLLPRWRGAAPIQAAVLAGDSETGITIMKMDSGVDSGPILSQRSLPIEAQETSGSLFEKLSHLGAGLLLETLPRYLSGELKPRPQPTQNITYTSLLKKKDGLLDFSDPAELLARKTRAFNPWPGAFVVWQDAPLKIHRAHAAIVFTYMALPPGTHMNLGGLPGIMTSQDVLVLDEVQPAGKRIMTGKAFLAGARDWEKSTGGEND